MVLHSFIPEIYMAPQMNYSEALLQSKRDDLSNLRES